MMKTRFDRRHAGLLLLGIFVVSTAGTMIGNVDAAVPEGWIQAGSHPQDYDMGVDRTAVRDGKPSAYVKSKGDKAPGFGTLMQKIDAARYRGKRVRLAAQVKSELVSEWAGLWMRVDGEGHKVLAFDNMMNRSIRGSNDWKRYEVVLDVAPEARAVAFGVLLAGKGSVFVNGMGIEPVDRSVATTEMPINDKPLDTEPTNLDFDR
jgi:hypothetical protein